MMWERSQLLYRSYTGQVKVAIADVFYSPILHSGDSVSLTAECTRKWSFKKLRPISIRYLKFCLLARLTCVRILLLPIHNHIFTTGRLSAWVALRLIRVCRSRGRSNDCVWPLLLRTLNRIHSLPFRIKLCQLAMPRDELSAPVSILASRSNPSGNIRTDSIQPIVTRLSLPAAMCDQHNMTIINRARMLVPWVFLN